MSLFIDEFFEDITTLRNSPVFEADGAYNDVLANEVRLAVDTNDVYLAYTNTGTSALVYALDVIGVKRGDEVVLSAWSFISDLLAVEQIGAVPVFVDVDPSTWLMDPQLLDVVLTKHKQVKAVLAVDMFGAPCDYLGLTLICQAHGVPLVEDAADALGQITPLGRCGAICGVDIAATSFNFAKPLGGYTTGGAILAKNVLQANELNERFNYGQFGEVDNGVHEAMSGVTCALTALRLRRRDTAKARRMEYLNMIHKYLDGFVQFQNVYPGTEHSWYNVTVVVDDDNIRSRLLENGKICKDAIINLPRFIKNNAKNYPVAAKLASKSITFFTWPCSPISELNVVLQNAVKSNRLSLTAKRLFENKHDDVVLPEDITTPAYVVNVNSFKTSYTRMKLAAHVAFGNKVNVLYAVKANNTQALVSNVTGVACSGVGELLDIHLSNVQEVHAHPVALCDDDADKLITLVDYVVLSTPDQVKRFATKFISNGVSVGIRLDAFGVGRHGAPIDEWLCADLSCVQGVHVHDANLLHYMSTHNAGESPLSKLLSLKHFDWLNLGGGMDENDIPSLEFFVNLLHNVPEKIYIEPGRALAASSTLLVTTILDVKKWKHEIVVDASAHCHANSAACGGKQLPLYGEVNDGEIWRLQGPTCMANDVLGDYRFTSMPQVGQRLVFMNAGAYTISNMNKFNGIQYPKIYVI